MIFITKKINISVMEQKILVIDDDLYIRELYEEVLKNAGFNVETAIDGEDAINKLKSGNYSLILLDMMMPKIDGLGVLKSLQQSPPTQKNGPIILLSNLGDGPVVKQAKELGVTDFLLKADITPDELLECVKKNLPQTNSN